ncbi:MAG: T9SS type A sorting domain-containing protein [Phaeodactylibacter sp.]|nr:T9SS type A sorting domain-containing protein [Phaeodactylibacter sp.]
MQAAYDSLYAIYKEQLFNDMQAAYFLNDGIEAEEQYETAEKAVTGIYLLSMLEGEGKLTESQVQELELIAQQCPEEGGLAVFNALGLLPECKREGLETCELELVNDIEPLSSIAPQGEGSAGSGAGSSVYLYPNPAASSFFLKLPSESTGEIIVAGLNGKTEFFRSNLAVDTRMEIRHYLSSGFYFVKIPLNDGSVLTEKLIIQSR